jgi:hypothetical protein
MVRIAVEIVLLFLVPTAVYLAWAMLARPDASAVSVFNEAPYVWLALAGAALVFGFLIYFGWTSGGTGLATDKPAAAARGIEARAVPAGAARAS